MNDLFYFSVLQRTDDFNTFALIDIVFARIKPILHRFCTIPKILRFIRHLICKRRLRPNSKPALVVNAVHISGNGAVDGIEETDGNLYPRNRRRLRYDKADAFR